MRYLLSLFFVLLICTACGGGKDNPAPKPAEKELGAFSLVFPDNNLICTEGTDLSDTEVSIELMWTASENASSYRVEIFDASGTAVSTETTTSTSASFSFLKDQQYSWKVTALLDTKARESSLWNFYSEGITTENYAPFPATITLSDNGDGTVAISWSGSDLDNDIKHYDIYLGDTANPTLYLDDTLEESISNFSITTGTTYYLEVVTVDNRGNESIATKQFKF